MLYIKIRDKRELEIMNGYKDLTYLGELVDAKPRDGENKTDEPKDPKPKAKFV